MQSSARLRNWFAKTSSRRLTVFTACAVLLAFSFGYYFVVQKSSVQAPLEPGGGQRPNAPHSSPVLSAPRAPSVDIASVVNHGRIVEIKGSTEPGASVMINGQPAATFFEGNSFRHFVGPLPAGTTVVTITIQNEQGGVTTRQLAVTVD